MIFFNRMEQRRKEKWNSFERLFFFTIACGFVVIIVAAKTMPVGSPLPGLSWIFGVEKAYAASGTVMDWKTTSANSDTLGRGVLYTDYNDALEYKHPSGSGDKLITQVRTTFQRSGTPAAGAKLVMYVYQDGSYPGAGTGSFLGSGSVLATSLPNTGTPTQVGFNINFTLTHGHKYYFLVGETDDSKAVFIYTFTCSNTAASGRPFFDTLSGGNWTHRGTTCVALKMFGGDPPPTHTESLVTLTSGVYTVGQQITFKASWNFNAEGMTPLYIHFFEDVNDNNSTEIPICTTLYNCTSSGSFTFQHAFNYPSPAGQPYNPTVDIGNCSGTGYRVNGGCSYHFAVRSNLTVINPSVPGNTQNLTYPSVFKSDQTIVKENTLVNFTFNVNEGICVGSSASGRRVFKGYPTNYLQYADTGAIVLTSSGHIALNYATDIGVMYFPKFRLYCADATSHDLYLGSTWLAGKAVGISVYTAADYAKVLNPTVFINGGATTTGSGTYSLESDKIVIDKYEPLTLRWGFSSQFGAVSSVRLYKDQNLLPNDYFDFSTAADKTSSYTHSYTITYSDGGRYQPSIVLTPVSGATRTIYLGGGTTPVALNNIIVTENIYSPSGYLTGTGSIYELGADVFTIPIDPQMSSLAMTSVIIANLTIRGLVSIAQVAFKFVSQSDFFRWVLDVIYPPSGSTRTVPASLTVGSYTFDLTTYMPNRTFTITYAAANPGMVALMQIAIAVSLIAYAAEKFFHHH